MKEIMNIVIFADFFFFNKLFNNFGDQYFLHTSYANEKLCISKKLMIRAFRLHASQILKLLPTCPNLTLKVGSQKILF
mgnify:CR=1 FL=1